MKPKWLRLGLKRGLKLGLYRDTLDAIEAKYKDDVDSCLLECLIRWLKKVDNVVNKGGPNWILLTNSLRDIDEVVAVADNVDQQSKSINTQL